MKGRSGSRQDFRSYQFAESLDDFRYVFNVVFNDQGYLPTSALATGALAMGVSPWIANLPLP